MRARIPHSIESTALLTEAMLHDVGGASQLNLRLAYSTAFCRFVNGLLDPAQQAQFAMSMHTLARSMRLPASFVEVRHAATHEALPSLPVLRSLTSRALDWLWANYWISVGPVQEDTDAAAEAAHAALLARARAVLKTWRRARRANPLREIKYGDVTPEGREAVKIINECAAICKEEDGVDALIDALLEEKALVPAGRKKGPLMKGAAMLWSSLLRELHLKVDGFLEQLLAAIIDTLKAAPSPAPLALAERDGAGAGEDSQDQFDPEFNVALVAWVETLTKPKFAKQSPISPPPLELEDLARQCILTPNEWSVRAHPPLFSLLCNLFLCLPLTHPPSADTLPRTVKALRHILSVSPELQARFGAVAKLAEAQASLSTPTALLPPSKKRKRGDGGHDVDMDLPAPKRRELERIEAEVRGFAQRLAVFEQSRLRVGKDTTTTTTTTVVNAGEVAAVTGVVGKGATTAAAVVVLEDDGAGKWRKWQGPWIPKPFGVLL